MGHMIQHLAPREVVAAIDRSAEAGSRGGLNVEWKKAHIRYSHETTDKDGVVTVCLAAIEVQGGPPPRPI